MTRLRGQPPPAQGEGNHAPRLADFAPQSILALAAEPQRAAAVLIEPVEGVYRMVAWQTVELPEQTDPERCADALVQAVNRLESQFSITLWDKVQDRPYTHASGPSAGEGVGQAVVVADLQPPLRLWLAGLSGGGSLAAAEAALAGALCNPVATYLPSPYHSANALAKELRLLRPEVILVVGGYEQMGRRIQEQVLALSRHVIEAASLLAASDRPLFCYAGSSPSAEPVLAHWRQLAGGGAALAADNVLAAPGNGGSASVHSVLAQLHWQKSLDLPAMQRLAEWLDPPLTLSSTHWAFAQGVRLWMRRQRLSELHGFYAGGDRWLHVWAQEFSQQGNDRLRISCVRPGERPEALARWPAIRLVSGDWPPGWPRPSRPAAGPGSSRASTMPAYWWDPLGLVPVVAGIGQSAPEAALQVLAADILEEDEQGFPAA